MWLASTYDRNLVQGYETFPKTRKFLQTINPIKAELNPICHLLALAGAHHFVNVSSLMVKQGFTRHITFLFRHSNLKVTEA